MTQDNPSAFPSRVDKPMSGGGSYRDDRPGMTLLDYFAGQALAGLLARPNMQTSMKNEDYAAVSYGLADAMLAARQSNDMEGETSRG